MNSFLPDRRTPGLQADARAQPRKELIVNRGLPTRTLREHPDLDQLKRQAKELLRAFTAGEEHAVTEVSTHYRQADRAGFALHDAQLVLARSYGFDSWSKLKAHVEGITLKRLVDAVRAGDLRHVKEAAPGTRRGPCGSGRRAVGDAPSVGAKDGTLRCADSAARAFYLTVSHVPLQFRSGGSSRLTL